jgi:hypothetical protein
MTFKSKDLNPGLFPEENIELFYFNIHGFHMNKFEKGKNWLINRNCDILFLSETWFSYKETVIQDVFVVAESLKPNKRKETGHENGGLLLMVRPEDREYITSLTVEEYFIKVCFRGKTFVGCYFPPRLSDQEVASIMDTIGDCDTFLGDINVRYGDFNDKVRRLLSRGVTISSHLDKFGLNRIPASNCSSDCDHLFSKENVEWTYNRLDPSYFSSDHGMMQASIKSRIMETDQVKQQLKFAYSVFKNPVLNATFSGVWDLTFGKSLFNSISYSCQFMMVESQNLGYNDNLVIINHIYLQFTDSIISCLNDFIPQYDDKNVKQLPDKQIAQLDEDLSTVSTLRRFKRLQRGKQPHVGSKDPLKTPLAESKEYFEKIFDSSLPKVSIPNFEYSYSSAFTTEEIKKSIFRYTLAKSGGTDGIHTICLRSLAASASFVSCLTELFNIFFSAGITPSVWNESLIYLLPKLKSGNTSESCRPVALTQIIRRLFEKLLLDRWYSENNDWLKLSDNQAGFRKGFSAVSQIATVDEVVRRSGPISIFLDLKSAYDKVPFQLLLDKLRKRGCSDRYLMLIYSLMMHECSSVISVNQSRSNDIIKRRKGLSR